MLRLYFLLHFSVSSASFITFLFFLTLKTLSPTVNSLRPAARAAANAPVNWLPSSRLSSVSVACIPAL